MKNTETMPQYPSRQEFCDYDEEGRLLPYDTDDDDDDDMMTDDTNFACTDTACTAAHCPECGDCDFDIADEEDPCNISLCPANFS